MRGKRIVHDHGVDVEFDDLRPGQVEPPKEKLLKQTAKQVGPLWRKGSIESFNGVRGYHVYWVCLDGSSVAGVFDQDVKVREVTACAVEEEAKDLLEEFVDWRSFGTFAHGTEEAVEVREKGNPAKITNEKIESGPACQAVTCDLDIVDNVCFIGFAFGHPALHQMGKTILPFDWMIL